MQNAVSALEPAVSGDDYAEFDEASVNGVRDADLAQAQLAAGSRADDLGCAGGGAGWHRAESA